MQSVSYKIWTRVSESPSHDDNRYATSVSDFGVAQTIIIEKKKRKKKEKQDE